MSSICALRIAGGEHDEARCFIEVRSFLFLVSALFLNSSALGALHTPCDRVREAIESNLISVELGVEDSTELEELEIGSAELEELELEIVKGGI